jgi:hypothetical protein
VALLPLTKSTALVAPAVSLSGQCAVKPVNKSARTEACIAINVRLAKHNPILRTFIGLSFLKRAISWEY